MAAVLWLSLPVGTRRKVIALGLEAEASPRGGLKGRASQKEAREDGPARRRPPGKGTSLVKEHYCPPRERIPEVVEAALLVRADLTAFDVRRWPGAAWETAVASPEASGRPSTWPSRGGARGRTRPASPNDCHSAA